MFADPQGGPSKPNDTNPGFLDPRTPVFDQSTVAQFLGAFGVIPFQESKFHHELLNILKCFP